MKDHCYSSEDHCYIFDKKRWSIISWLSRYFITFLFSDVSQDLKQHCQYLYKHLLSQWEISIYTIQIPILLCSIGLERAFSSFDLLHTKLRNCLENARVIKLAKTYCYLQDKQSDDVGNIELFENMNQVIWVRLCRMS